MFPDLLRDDVFRVETKRLWLRWPRASDAAEIARLAGDAEGPECSDRVPRSLSSAVAFVARARHENSEGKSVTFVLTDKQRPSVPLGAITVEESEKEWLTLSFWLGRSHCKGSLVNEAVRAIVDLAFTWTTAIDIVSTIGNDTSVSQQALEKCGFQPAGKASDSRAAAAACHRYLLRRREWLRGAATPRGSIHISAP